MIVGIQEELLKIQSLGLLDRLLFDKTTKRNILWATDAYKNLGVDFGRDKEIKVPLITGHNSFVIKNRARKALEQQTERVKQHGEVFTPFWVSKKMIDCADENWFGAPDVFFADGMPTAKINFPPKRTWQQYADSRRLEIACGEAPFLVSRYDVLTGEIIPIENRTGILDRKLRAVNENAADEKEWLKWALRAFQATYGYEFQGDNLLIARINLLMTFEEYLYKRWRRKPTEAEYRTITNIIAWNIWQMDGLTGKIPYCAAQNFLELSLFDNWDSGFLQPQADMQPPCRIYDWRRGNSLEFLNVNKGGRNMKFDFIIGNPPYQQDSKGDNESDTPLYHYFYDEAFKIANVVELITPARFLFNAGYTPKTWNQKMLNDEHFKILSYEPKSNKIFSNTDIKGGIAIGYRNTKKNYGAIGVFTAYPELNSIKSKVDSISTKSLCDIITNRGLYRYSNKAYKEQPEEMKKTADARIAPSAFERMPLLFTDEKPNDGYEYIQIYGNIKSQRYYKWFRKDYVKDVSNLYKYKVMIPKANGSGAIGEVMSTPLIGLPLIGLPLVGFTETYISIGETDSKNEAEAILKYVKSKFARTMLGILKVTQNNAKPTWAKVPMQDFTSNSDIDWSKSVAEIDKQLYKKYGLDEQEIKFIETHVKEMA